MQVVEQTSKIYKKLTWTWESRRATRRRATPSSRTSCWHWFPNKISKRSVSLELFVLAGTISFVLFAILVFTGVILMFLYVPSVERAYSSIKDIEFVVSFGWLLRAMHRISAHLMVAAVFFAHGPRLSHRGL